MLYPKEDRMNNTLMFACRTCQYSEAATAACIYRNSLQEQIAETAGNVEDVAQDPTVGDSDYDTARDSFIEDGDDPSAGMDYGGDDDVLPETCTFCGQEILCPHCGQPTDNFVALEVDDPDKAKDDKQEEEMVEAEKRERTLSSAGLKAY